MMGKLTVDQFATYINKDYLNKSFLTSNIMVFESSTYVHTAPVCLPRKGLPALTEGPVAPQPQLLQTNSMDAVRSIYRSRGFQEEVVSTMLQARASGTRQVYHAMDCLLQMVK